MKKQDPIHINPAHKGKLHEALGVPADKKIPAARIEQAKHSNSPSVRKMANFAANASHWSGK